MTLTKSGKRKMPCRNKSSSFLLKCTNKWHNSSRLNKDSKVKAKVQMMTLSTLTTKKWTMTKIKNNHVIDKGSSTKNATTCGSVELTLHLVGQVKVRTLLTLTFFNHP